MAKRYFILDESQKPVQADAVSAKLWRTSQGYQKLTVMQTRYSSYDRAYKGKSFGLYVDTSFVGSDDRGDGRTPVPYHTYINVYGRDATEVPIRGYTRHETRHDALVGHYRMVNHILETFAGCEIETIDGIFGGCDGECSIGAN